MGETFEGITIIAALGLGLLGFKTTAIVLMLFGIYELLYDVRKNGIFKKG